MSKKETMNPKPQDPHKKKHQKKDHAQKEKEIHMDEPKIEILEKSASEKDDYLDQLKRLKADFENYKKRVIKEREQLRQVLNEDLILEVLPIIDNFGHALNSSKQSKDFSTLLVGIEMIHKQLLSLLANRNVVPIKAMGELFNPNLHEAIAYEDSEDDEELIINETLTGYLMNGKLLRPSKVRVSKGRPT